MAFAGLVKTVVVSHLVKLLPGVWKECKRIIPEFIGEKEEPGLSHNEQQSKERGELLRHKLVSSQQTHLAEAES